MNLIIGNGLIGKALYYLLREDAALLTRKEVDLREDNWELPHFSVSYICAGITSTEYCEQNPKESYLVNVTNTVKLAKKLKQAGGVVWVSSERVFNGSVPFRKVGDSPCPITEYGRQKSQTEKELLDIGVTVVRFSKVIGWDMPLFEEWIQALRDGLEIRPYSNMSMSPMPVGFAAKVLKRASEIGGLLQVSADRDITYLQAAHYIVGYMNKDFGLVQPAEAVLGHPNTTLKPNISGIDPPEAWETIHHWCKERLF